MDRRVLPLLVGFVLALSGAGVQAQTLSPTQKAKLDGRFERILQFDAQGVLEARIERFSEKLRRAGRVDGSTTGQVHESVLSGRAKRSPGIKSQFGDIEAALLSSDHNVQPDARTTDGTPLYDAVVYTEEVSRLSDPGVQVTSSFDEFAVVRVTPSALRSVSGRAQVERVMSPNVVRSHNDVAAAEVGARTLNQGAVGGRAYRGQDVMVCIVDSGIDWSHPDFMGPDGNSRIQYIWDQSDDTTSVPTPVENDASRFGSRFNPDYGAEYLSARIQEGRVIQTDTDGHGTHVAGTAASSGRAYEQSDGTKRYVGAAPGADIVAVKAIFNEAGIINGVNYCRSVAKDEGKPVVVNLSLGTVGSIPRDGTAPLAKAVENITSEGTKPGMVVVTSAGNEGSEAVHTGPFALDDSVDVPVTVSEYDTTSGNINDRFQASLWAYEEGTYSVSVYSPGAKDTLTLTVDDPGAVVDTSRETPRGQITLSSSPSESARSFSVTAYDATSTRPPAEGVWTIRVRAEGGGATDLHGWFGESSIPASFEQADRNYTLTAPGTSRGTITVGNYVHRQRWTNTAGTSLGFQLGSGFTRDRIAGSSSRGPTADGRQKPEVGAPGTFTASAFSDDADGPAFGSEFLVGNGDHQLLAGTSMSAPITAGATALLLQQDPSLSVDDVRDLLANTARVDRRVEARGGEWNSAFGYGKVSVVGALIALRRGDFDGEFSSEILAYEDEFDNANASAEEVGGAGAQRVALRFTPTVDGPVTGAYLSLGSEGSGGPANELTDSLYVQVWSDDGTGTPGTPLGQRVAVPKNGLAAFTPNFVSLNGAEVDVQAGTNYHLVVAPKEGGGTIEILAETAGATAGRSLAYDGSTWSDVEGDLVLRVQVRKDVRLDLTPPERVASIETVAAQPHGVELEWADVEASDLARYRIYRDTRPLPAVQFGLTPFATVSALTTSYTDTTATVGQTYYYRVTAVDSVRNESSLSDEVYAFLYPDEVPVSVRRSFAGTAGASPSSYRLVALPGAVNRPLAETLDGRVGLDWQAYWDDGSQFVKFDGSESFRLRAGTGFWVTSTSDWTVEEQFSTVRLTADSMTTIPLHEGWNIISNPADKNVSFTRVRQAHTASLPPLWSFETGFFRRADSLASAATGRAYYFLNDAGLDSLRIPYPGAPIVSSADEKHRAVPRTTRSTLDTRELMTLSARPVEADDDRGSRVHVGFNSEAADGVGQFDRIAPPSRFEPVSLRIEPPSPPKGTRQQFLVVEQRPPSSDEGDTFDVQLRAEPGQRVVLAPSGVRALGRQKTVLLHPATGKTYDLAARDSITLTTESKETTLRLAVGSDEYVASAEQDVRPEEVSLTTYPNPMARQGTVEFALPTASTVRLVVYDVLGRKVATLVNERRDAGRHRVLLDTENLSSGVYFGRLRVGDKQWTERLTVVR